MLMNSKSGVEFDAASATLLAPAAGQSWSGSGRKVGTPIALPHVFGAMWDDDVSPELATGLMVVNIHVSNIGGTGDETFDFALEAGDVGETFGSPAHPALSVRLTVLSEAGRTYRMAVDGASVKAMLVGLEKFALSVTLAGDAPEISYRAWLSHAKA